MSHKEINCLRSYFAGQFPDSGYFSANRWLLKQVMEHGKFLLAELGRDFLEVEELGREQRLYMTGKRWEKDKTVSGNFNYLTPGNLTASSTTSVSFKEAGGG